MHLPAPILAQNVKSLTAIERDIRCVNALEYLETAYPQQLKIVNCDALNIPTDLVLESPVKIISNLPYNISTTLLTKWITVETMATLVVDYDSYVSERSCRQNNRTTK